MQGDFPSAQFLLLAPTPLFCSRYQCKLVQLQLVAINHVKREQGFDNYHNLSDFLAPAVNPEQTTNNHSSEYWRGTIIDFRGLAILAIITLALTSMG